METNRRGFLAGLAATLLAPAVAKAAGILPTDSGWYHFAICRQDAATKVFVNGEYAGFIDELRVLKGSAQWLATFTPPEEKFGTITIDGHSPLNVSPSLIDGKDFTLDYWIKRTDGDEVFLDEIRLEKC